MPGTQWRYSYSAWQVAEAERGGMARLGSRKLEGERDRFSYGQIFERCKVALTILRRLRGRWCT